MTEKPKRTRRSTTDSTGQGFGRRSPQEDNFKGQDDFKGQPENPIDPETGEYLSR